MLSSVTNVLLKVRQHAICHVIIVFFCRPVVFYSSSFFTLHPASLGSNPAGTYMNHWWWQDGHPANIALVHQPKSNLSCYARLSLEQGVNDVKLD